MTAFVRLWRRAPRWRWALFFAGAGSALTAAYPPAWLGGPAIPPQPEMVSSLASTPAQDASARPDPTPVARGVPVLGDLYAKRLPLGAQSVPLPPGDWQVLAIAGPTPAAGGRAPAMSAFLALVLGGRIAAAAVISGSVPPDRNDAGFPAPLELQTPNFYYRRVLASVDHGPLDVWVCGTTQPAHWTDPLRKAALGVLRTQGLGLPDQLESVVFRMAGKSNWVSAEFMFAAPTADPGPVRPWTEVALLPETAALTHIEKVRRWGKAWHTIMRHGFAGGTWSPDEARIALP